MRGAPLQIRPACKFDQQSVASPSAAMQTEECFCTRETSPSSQHGCDVQELKVQVGDALKSVVKAAAWAIEQGTEVAYGFAPDSMERSTV